MHALTLTHSHAHTHTHARTCRHRFFNTNNLWVNLRKLRATLRSSGGALKLPLIRNKKTVGGGVGARRAGGETARRDGRGRARAMRRDASGRGAMPACA